MLELLEDNALVVCALLCVLVALCILIASLSVLRRVRRL